MNPFVPSSQTERNQLEWLAYLEGTSFANAHAAKTWSEALDQSSDFGDHLWKALANPRGETQSMWYADAHTCLEKSSARAQLPILAALIDQNDDYAMRVQQTPEMYHRWTDLAKGGGCYNTTSLGVPYHKAAECLEKLAPALPSLLSPPARRKMMLSLRFTGVDDALISPMGRVCSYIKLGTYLSICI